MELVLGVHVAQMKVRMVLVEAPAVDGHLVDFDEFDVSEGAALSLIAIDQVVSAIVGTCQGAAAQGHRLTGTVICYADDIDVSVLRAALTDHGLADAVLVDERQSAAALAGAVGAAPERPQLALARGATLVGVNSGQEDISTVALAYSQDPDPPLEAGTSDTVAPRGNARAMPLPVGSVATAAVLTVATALGITLMVDVSPTVDQQRRSDAAIATPNVVILSPPAAAPTVTPTTATIAPKPPSPAATAAAPAHSTQDPDPTLSGVPESAEPAVVSASPSPVAQTSDAAAAPASPLTPAPPSAVPPQPHAPFADPPDGTHGVSATRQTALPPAIFLPLVPRWLQPMLQGSASSGPPIAWQQAPTPYLPVLPPSGSPAARSAPAWPLYTAP